MLIRFVCFKMQWHVPFTYTLVFLLSCRQLISSGPLACSKFSLFLLSNKMNNQQTKWLWIEEIFFIVRVSVHFFSVSIFPFALFKSLVVWRTAKTNKEKFTLHLQNVRAICRIGHEKWNLVSLGMKRRHTGRPNERTKKKNKKIILKIKWSKWVYFLFILSFVHAFIWMKMDVIKW